VREDRIVIRLNDLDGEGESGEDILDKGFGGVGGHFFMELDEAQAGTAVNGCKLVKFSAFHEVGDEFYIDLYEVAWGRDSEDFTVSFGPGFSFVDQAVAFNDFVDGKGGRNFGGAMVEEELTESHGSQVGFLA
jgi:hypothetical protein